MSRKRIIYMHVFIWLFAIFATIPYQNLSSHIPEEQVVAYIFAFFYQMSAFYLFYLVLVPKLLDRKKIVAFFGSTFIVVLAMPFLGYSILFLNRALFSGSFKNFYHGYSFAVHMSAFFPILTAAIFGSFFKVIINWFTTMNQKAELDKEMIAVELELLKSKLNPHFLFNTLNNIDSLIHQDPGKASSELIRLSDMMRYLTYETSSDKVELEREVDYIENFIELNRIRIKTPGAINFEVTGNMAVKVSPALFVPLIENAFKFATFRDQQPAIQILISSDKGFITFEISNYYERKHDTETSFSGFGISNLRKRLELTYPGKYQLVIEPGEIKYYVKLSVDTNEN